jgi:hypothetical protein
MVGAGAETFLDLWTITLLAVLNQDDGARQQAFIP